MTHTLAVATFAAETGMLIRKPVSEVFEAFRAPEITTRFWFTRSSGRLEPGARVQWDWEMYGVSIPIEVKAIEPQRRIVIEWPGEGATQEVEWTFQPMSAESTYVAIAVRGFNAAGEALAKQAADATEGFALVLAGLKALLEHGVQLNLVLDRFPPGVHDAATAESPTSEQRSKEQP